MVCVTKDFFLISVASWLAAVPTLCRAEILSGCCNSSRSYSYCEDGIEGSVAPCADDDCGEHADPCRSTPLKECGACAGVCVGVVKPVDHGEATTLVAQVSWLISDFATMADFSPQSSLDCLQDSCAERFHLPFPTSDIPLLI